MSFKHATRLGVAPKVAIQGVSGAGKTYSSILFARGMCDRGGRIAVVDTENGSASLYSDLTDFDVSDIRPRTFGVGKQAVTSFWWTDFRDAIQEAIDAKYDVLVIDSASHIWQATLDFKTRLDQPGTNSFTNWNAAGQTFSTVQNMILQAPIPVICCFRSKIEYALEVVENGKTTPKKIGLAPITRNDSEYDFTLCFDIDRDHCAMVSKSRCCVFGDDFNEPLTEKHGELFKNWLK